MRPFEKDTVISYGRKKIEVLKCSHRCDRFDEDLPDGVIHNEIAWRLADKMKPFIEFDNKTEPDGALIYTGTIRVVGKDI